MKRDEHKGIITQLLGMVTNEHQARASELLTNLSDDYEEILTQSEQASANVETLTRNNETLREVNAKLFLRVGETEKSIGKQEIDTDKPSEETPLAFESLFNEKGDLI